MASGTALEAADWAWMRLVLLAASTWLLARILDTAQLIARSCEEVVAPEPEATAVKAVDDEDEAPPVGLRVRAVPLIEMLHHAASKDSYVMWRPA